MKTKYAEHELQTGDLIAIASDSYIDIGWYLGRGKTGTLQYCTINSAYWAATSNKKVYKCYINTPTPVRILKITPECITDKEELEKYEKALELMKELKIVKQ